MGGGYSSVSKIMVVSPSTRKDVDVDYLFGQVDIKTATVVRLKSILMEYNTLYKHANFLASLEYFAHIKISVRF